MEGFDSYVDGGEDMSHTRPFDSDGYMGFDPRLPSQRFDSFRMPPEGEYTQEDYKNLGGLDEEDEYAAPKEGTSSNGGFDEAPPPYHGPFDDDLDSAQSPSMSSTFGQSFESRLQPEYTPTDDFSTSMDSNGKGFGHNEGFPHGEGFGHGEVDSLYGYPPSEGGAFNNNGSAFNNGGAVLPPPEEMQSEEGFVLREWKRKNALHLEEKARIEREKLAQIIDAADAFKEEFYAKRRTHCESNKNNNREKEKVFLENLQNFHSTADKHYWKAVAELVPHELPALEQRSRGNKDKDKKKPTVVINHGPKPGKATDLTRMRQVLVKLKHNPPEHMKAPPPPVAPPKAVPSGEDAADAKASGGAVAGELAPAPAAPLEKQGSIPAVVVV